MIKLKSGKIVDFDDNYDQFFQNLMQKIIEDSVHTAKNQCDVSDVSAYNSILLKELMDNSIYVTHQIFDLAKVNKNLSKFLVTGFLFNSMVLSIPELESQTKDTDDPETPTIQ